MQGTVSIWVRVQQQYDMDLHSYVDAIVYKISEGAETEWSRKYYGEEGWVFVQNLEIGCPTDHITMEHVKSGMVEGLRRKQTSLRAEAEAACTVVQKEINKLLSLTYVAPEDSNTFPPIKRDNSGAEDVIPF